MRSKAKLEHEGAAPVWMVRNKIDLGRRSANGRRREEFDFEISASRGDGLHGADLGPGRRSRRIILARREGGLISRERQRQLLQQTADSLRRSIAMVGQGEEFAAEDLRAAAQCLGRLLGRVDVEDILDVIFRDSV